MNITYLSPFFLLALISPFSTDSFLPRMSTLRSRKSVSSPPIEKEEHIRTVKISMAFSSVQYCYRATFFSVFVDVVSAVRESVDWSNLTWADALKVVQAVNILGFGIGLYRAAHIYNSKSTLASDDIVYMATTVARLYFHTTWVMVMGSMCMASSLSDYINNVPVSAGPTLLVTLFVVGARILKWIEMPPPLSSNPEFNETRKTGFCLAHNMALAILAFSLNGFARFAIWLAKQPSMSLLERVIGMTDVTEPLVIAYLLMKLRRCIQEDILFITFAGEKESDLYGAQKDFYEKIGTTLLSQAALQLATPYIILAKEFVLKFASKFV